jgi:ElaB/YqjD/DUF883 family membrane-anchored ribosome-binding protein
MEDIRKTTRDAAETAWDSLKDVRGQGEAAWEDTQKLVRKYPGKAIGLALLAGTVIGALLAFRSDD